MKFFSNTDRYECRAAGEAGFANRPAPLPITEDSDDEKVFRRKMKLRRNAGKRKEIKDSVNMSYKNKSKCNQGKKVVMKPHSDEDCGLYDAQHYDYFARVIQKWYKSIGRRRVVVDDIWNETMELLDDMCSDQISDFTAIYEYIDFTVRVRVHNYNRASASVSGSVTFDPHAFEKRTTFPHGGFGRGGTLPVYRAPGRFGNKRDRHVSQPISESCDISDEEAVNQNEKWDRLFSTFSGSTDKTSLSDFGDILSDVQDLTDKMGGTYSGSIDIWVNHIENLAIFGSQVCSSGSLSELMVAFLSYIKKYTSSRSIIGLFIGIFKHAFSADPALVPHGTGNEIVSYWELLKSNPLFSKLSYLISAALSISACSIKNVDWDVCGVKLLSIHAAKEQISAVDFIDAIIKTFVWLMEVGVQVIKEKSLRPIFYSDVSIREYMELSDEVLAYGETACAGNLVEDLVEYERKLDFAMQRTCVLKKCHPTGPSAVWLQRRYSDLVALKERILAKHRNAIMRMAPIGWSISGGTCIGKSTLAKMTMKTSLIAMGFDASPDRIITLDRDDKYQSTYTSDVLGVYFDDFGNTRSEHVQEAPTNNLIKFFNNVAAQAIKAEIQAKGCVFIDFRVGVITTNVKDLNASLYSNCPESVLRRFIHVVVEVKPEFCIPGSTMLNDKHPRLVNSPLTQDIWNIELQEIFTEQVSETDTRFTFRTMVVQMDGQDFICKNLSLQRYLMLVKHLSTCHRQAQDNLLKRSIEFDAMTMCVECGIPSTICVCKCAPHAKEDFTDFVVQASTGYVFSLFRSWMAPISLLGWLVGFQPVQKMLTKSIVQELDFIVNTCMIPYVFSYVPAFFFRFRIVKFFLQLYCKSSSALSIRKQIRNVSFVLLCVFLCFRNQLTFPFVVICIMVGYLYVHLVWYTRWRRLSRELEMRADGLTCAANCINSQLVTNILAVSTGVLLGITILKVWNKYRIIRKYEPNSL